jgi:hypothetical protein
MRVAHVKISCMVFWQTPVSMVYRTPYLWYFDPLAHGISNLIPLVYRTFCYRIMNPLHMVLWPPIHGMLNHIHLAYQTTYPWYFGTPTQCILNYIPMVSKTPYPWHIKLGSIFHVHWSQYAISGEFDISWIEGSQNTMAKVRYAMDREFKIHLVGGSRYHV